MLDYFNTPKSPTGRLLAGTCMVLVIALVFCNQVFWRDPHSWFYNSERAHELHYTLHRQHEARQYIDAARSLLPDHATRASQNGTVICTGIVTVKRKGVDYLSDTVGSMLATLTPGERAAINVRLLFANIKPEVHPDYNATWLEVLDNWGPYNLTAEQLKNVTDYVKDEKLRRKWSFDYIYMLEQCLNETSAPYIAIIEDDVIFADGWLSKTLEALRNIGHIQQKSGKWLYLRLFYTESFLGWDKDVDSWYTNPILSYCLAMSVCFAMAIVARTACRKNYPYIKANIAWITVLTCVTIPTVITLLFLIGHHSLIPQVKDFMRMDQKGCCNQALVYPRSQAPHVIAMLNSTKPAPTDWMIEDWANEEGLARYAVNPPVSQHIGLVSSRKGVRRFSKKTWAYWFEGQSAERLKQEHERLSRKELYRDFT